MDNLDNKDDDLKRGPGPDNPEDGKPEAAPNPPEDHDDGKKEEKKRGKKNPYDQYKYWGSDGDGPSSGGPKFKGGRPNRVALIIFILLREPLIGLFMTEESQEALSIGKTFLLIVSPFFFLVSIKFIADGVLRGAAAMSWFMTATFVDLAARVILAFLFSIEFDSTGIWLAWPVGWTISCLMSLSFYLVGVWKPKPSRVK